MSPPRRWRFSRRSGLRGDGPRRCTTTGSCRTCATRSTSAGEYNQGPFLSLPALQQPPASSKWLTGGNLPAVQPRLSANGARAGRFSLRDVLMLLGVVLSIPFVILAFGLPIVLVVQLLLWIGRLV